MTPHSRTTLLLCAALLAGACTPHAHPPAAAEDDGPPSQALLVFRGPYEFFVDTPVLPPGATSTLSMHVTEVASGAPRAAGPLEFRFRQGDEAFAVRADAPAVPGIWQAEAVLPAEGEWALEVEYDGVVAAMGALLATADPARAAALPAPPADAVTVLKQQSWPARIRCEEVGTRALEERLPVVVHATPVPAASAKLRAPSFGRLEAAEGTPWPELGAQVEAGALIGVVRMPLLPGDPATSTSARLQAAEQRRAVELGAQRAAAELRAAEAEQQTARLQLTRIEELHRSGARPDRELELARQDAARADAAAEAAAQALGTWRQALADEDAAAPVQELVFELRAPCSGIIVEADYAPGAWVDGEDELMHVVDTARLRFGVRMHVDDLARLDAPRTFARAPGGATLELPGPGGRLLLARPPVDPGSHVGELVYEAPAPHGLLPGAVLQGEVSIGEPRQALAVPISALVDEDGLPVVFVQVGGEAYERRVVRLGLRGIDAVEVLEGVAAGERVVVDGAYTIRLASLAGAVPEHHH